MVRSYRAGRLQAKAFLRWEPSRCLMDILRPLLCVNLVELSLRSGLRFPIGVQEGVEVATIKRSVVGGWAWVGVGRRVERQGVIKQERRLASFPPHLGTSASQGTRRKRRPGSQMCFW
jgi:hypothetical protein